MLKYFLIFVLLFENMEQKPVLMWESTKDQNTSISKYSSLHFESCDFKTIISRISAKKMPIIVFLEDTLSVEDFIIRNEYGSTIFQGLSSLMNNFNSLFIPHVENPLNVIEEVASPVKKVDLDNLYNMCNWNDVRSIIVDLKKKQGNESRQNIMKKHDSTILRTHSKLLDMHVHILSIFTARYPSWRDRSGRQNLKLLQLEPDNEIPSSEPPKVAPIVDDKNLLLYVSGNAEYSTDNGAKFTSITLSRSAFTITDHGMSLTLDGGSEKFVFSISLGLDGFWKIDNITVKEKTLQFQEIAVPMNFSYHCSNFELWNRQTKQFLRIPGFQIQPFKEGQEKPKFGTAFDCVGFVTIPICSGIFVIAIFLVILFFGIIAMMDIKTPDRFDDPNGKVFKAYVEYY